MIPKEKAKELIEKYQFVEIANYTSMFEVKQCALIAVDEILDDGNASSPFEEYRIMYWNEVKQEIDEL